MEFKTTSIALPRELIKLIRIEADKMMIGQTQMMRIILNKYFQKGKNNER